MHTFSVTLFACPVYVFHKKHGFTSRPVLSVSIKDLFQESVSRRFGKNAFQAFFDNTPICGHRSGLHGSCSCAFSRADMQADMCSLRLSMEVARCVRGAFRVALGVGTGERREAEKKMNNLVRCTDSCPLGKENLYTDTARAATNTSYNYLSSIRPL